MASSWSNFRNSGESGSHNGHEYNFGQGAQQIQHTGTGPMNNTWNNYYGRGRSPEREQEVDVQLQSASRSDSEERVRSLLNDHKAHPWCVDQDGMTPLHHASASTSNKLEILDMLIQKGANVDALNKAGESPLRLAINKRGRHSAKANYIRSRGGNDIGPPAVRSSFANPPNPPARPPQAETTHSRNTTRDLSFFPSQSIAHLSPIVPDQNNSPYQNISPIWSSPALIHRSAEHMSELEEIASNFDYLDDFKPLAEYNSLPMEDRAIVDRMVSEREAREVEEDNARIHGSRNLWGYNFS